MVDTAALSPDTPTELAEDLSIALMLTLDRLSPPVVSDATTAKHARLVSAFVSAAQSGDLEVLTGLLARDARVISDGGGKVPAALNVIVGNDRAARFLIGVSRKGLRAATARFALVNGLPGLIVEGAGGLIQTVAFEIAEDDRIRAV